MKHVVYTKSLLPIIFFSTADMAIAIGKKMNLFVDEADLQETIDFWKFYKDF